MTGKRKVVIGSYWGGRSIGDEAAARSIATAGCTPYLVMIHPATNGKDPGAQIMMVDGHFDSYVLSF